MKKFDLRKLGMYAVAALVAMSFVSCDDDDDNDNGNGNGGGTSTDVIAKLKAGVMEGTLEENYTLDADVEYRLTGEFIVSNGVTLTVPAGTHIEANNGGTDVYLAVLMGGKINVNGTADNPVVMASGNSEPGDWGGLTICGKGITTSGANSTAEVGGFIYGGSDNADNSGSLTYLVIRGTGAQIDSESQYNGLSLYAVGSGTKIENIAIHDGADDGVEFFGGAAEVKNIYIENTEDDAVDWTEGWNGSVENTYISHTVSGFSTAFEADKENGNPTFTNVTAISTVSGTALQFKKQSGATITGLYLEGYGVDLDMKDGGPTANVIIGGSAADVTLLQGETSKYELNSGKSSTKVDVSGWTWKNAGL